MFVKEGEGNMARVDARRCGIARLGECIGREKRKTKKGSFSD